MRIGRLDLANFIGTHIIPYTNPRVVCPPGRIHPKGRLNIIVATPMRSGTHILIDILLNNLPLYRNRPLYVDLDQCYKNNTHKNDLLNQITSQAGYVLKTHMPVNVKEGMEKHARIKELIQAGVVVVVRRDKADVCRSLSLWNEFDRAFVETKYGPQYDEFWPFWDKCNLMTVAFEDLFKPNCMQDFLLEVGSRLGIDPSHNYKAPPLGANRSRIYCNKMFTRLLGERAPQIDTTIHTLK